jgi:hypothetical protein
MSETTALARTSLVPESRPSGENDAAFVELWLRYCRSASRANACQERSESRSNAEKQNVTISISLETVRKARILAAHRSTRISGLLLEEIEKPVGAGEAWERSERSALALLEQGFHLRGLIPASRDELHAR